MNMTNYIDELNDLKSRDAFFTCDDVSYECIDILLKYIDISLFDLIIEPSAGDGSFIRAMKNHDEFKNSSILSFDIYPMKEYIKQADWLKINCDDMGAYNNLLIIGNPPFGNRSSMAKAFIKKSIELNASVIAFILPNIFMKEINQRFIPNDYRLICNHSLKDDSFTIGGDKYNIPAVFQIWCNNSSIFPELDLRAIKPKQPEEYSFLKRGDTSADFTINGNSGQVKSLSEVTNSKAEHYIKVNEKYSKNKIINIFKNINFRRLSSVSGGNYWINRDEINKAFQEYINSN